MKWLNSKVILLLIAVVSTWISSNIHWGKDNWMGILESDAKGYYAYLPAYFIYHDPSFKFLLDVEKKYPQPHLFVDYRSFLDEGVVNKYYLGSAFLQTPFFLIAHGVTLAQDPENADGYSKWYQIFVSISSIFYMLLGLFFLRKSLILLKIQDHWISFLLITCLFGTNLFVYSITDAAYSHIYSFAVFSAFTFYCLLFFYIENRRLIFLLSALLGLIILIRPINGLIVFSLPFLAGSYERFNLLLKSVFKVKIFIPSILIGFFFPFLQLLYYYIATDHWWVYSYQEEGFNFTDPHLFDILFSYQKGLFLYTPIYLLSFLGLIPLWKFDRFRFWWWLVFFLFITYIFSSWWMWFYGASFSSRVYVEFLPLFMILFAFYLKDLKSVYQKWGIGIASFLLIALCQIQIYQYRHYVIHYSEMNKEKYWDAVNQMFK